MGMEVYTFKDKKALALSFCERLHKSIGSVEDFHLALSGGSTPRIIFETLASKYHKTLAWDKLHIYWGDERCVPPEHAESNYKMAIDTFLTKVEIPKNQIHRMKGEVFPDVEAERYGGLLKDRLPQKSQLPEFDLIMLGLGDDGHTVSIFPHQIDLWDTPKTCVVAEHPVTGQQRISLTGQVINNAKEVCFLVTGRGKAKIVRELLESDENKMVYPASLVNPTSGKLLWYLDETAASELSNQNYYQQEILEFQLRLLIKFVFFGPFQDRFR